MALSDTRAWLVAYDVRDERRLHRVHQWMAKNAMAVQYSVFVGVWNGREFAAVWAGLKSEINWKQDDVRAYPLPHRCQAELRGRARTIEETRLVARGFPIFKLLWERGEEGIEK